MEMNRLQQVSLLIVHADYVITVDRDRRIYKDGAVAIDDGKIIVSEKVMKTSPILGV